MTVLGDPYEGGEQPICPACGTVMRDADGGYECGGCGFVHSFASVDRPDAGDELPGIRGG